MKNMLRKINIAIIAGGISNEREISLKTSQQIISALSKDKYNVSLIEITKENKWLLKDTLILDENHKEEASLIIKEKDEHLPQHNNIFKNIDLAFIALHGKNGEDGRIQAVLDLLNIPYTGSGVLASALGMNKMKCLEFVSKFNIKTPRFLVLRNNDFNIDEMINLVDEKINYPCVVKPNESGSSIGVSIINKQEELESAIKLAFNEDNVVVIEQYIKGRELTCGVMGNTGYKDFLLLPPIEVIAVDSSFFDYNAKYFSKKTKEICPAEISDEMSSKIQNEARLIHELLGCDGLTRSDFILSEVDNQLYFLEINTIPGQTESSLCPKEAKAIGMDFSDFVEKQIDLALKKYER